MKKESIVVVILIIIFLIIAVGLSILFLSHGDVRIVSVDWDISYGEYQPGEFTENIYLFNVEIKNIGTKGIDYTVHLYQYRVSEDAHGHLDDANEASGYLDAGDTTTVKLSTSVLADYLMFDAKIQIYSYEFTDEWITRIIQ